ncbi:MAG: DUF2269 domain-containing protein [Chitinophagaceae bacterium]|nr:DUF2269 domain-containing protein [Chitinophagaceae bacterium]
MSLYTFIKFLHILSAIIAIGFNFSYAVWTARAKKAKEHTLFALKGIKALDDWLANPSYILSLITGHIMVWMTGMNILKVSWLLYAEFTFALMGIVGFGFYSPVLRKQIKTLQQQGIDSAAYKAVDKKQTRIGFTLFVLALVLLVLMVFKPMWQSNSLALYSC